MPEPGEKYKVWVRVEVATEGVVLPEPCYIMDRVCVAELSDAGKALGLVADFHNTGKLAMQGERDES